VEGNLIKDTEFWGNMDPFIVLEVGNEKFKTTTVQEGGKNPVWQEKFDIPL